MSFKNVVATASKASAGQVYDYRYHTLSLLFVYIFIESNFLVIYLKPIDRTALYERWKFSYSRPEAVADRAKG